jgi:hypothetical protein
MGNLVNFNYSDNSYGNVENCRRHRFTKIFVENFQCFGIDENDLIYSWGLNDVKYIINLEMSTWIGKL